MKTLLFIRHGKSSWEYDVPDRMRPLKKRGKEDGVLVGQALNELNLTLDAVYSSPANRAFSTCKIVCEQLKYPIAAVEKEEDLYDFGGQGVLQFIKQLPDGLATVGLFGHNHAFTALINLLGSTTFANVPTTGAVLIEFKETSWNKITQGITKNSIFPKELK